MTIHDIKRAVEQKGGFFFTRNNMKAAGQTMRDFHTKKISDRVVVVYTVGCHLESLRLFSLKDQKLISEYGIYLTEKEKESIKKIKDIQKGAK